jgi:ABC-type transporter Mla MlaB component
MLKIEVNGQPGKQVTLRLEGRMVGPWVGEVRRACEAFLGNGNALVLDLAGVSFVDRDGVALLRTLRRRHAAVANCSAFVKELLDA